MYAEEGDITRTIQAAIRVAAYQYADYTEMTVRDVPLYLGKWLTLTTVSKADCAVLLQVGPDSWSCQDLVYSSEHGFTRPDPENHG
jgi:hypothetical protein